MTNPLLNDDTPGVGQDDYTRWRAHFGQTAGSSAGATGSAIASTEPQSAAVPEPATILLLASSALLLAASRPRRC